MCCLFLQARVSENTRRHFNFAGTVVDKSASLKAEPAIAASLWTVLVASHKNAALQCNRALGFKGCQRKYVQFMWQQCVFVQTYLSLKWVPRALVNNNQYGKHHAAFMAAHQTSTMRTQRFAVYFSSISLFQILIQASTVGSPELAFIESQLLQTCILSAYNLTLCRFEDVLSELVIEACERSGERELTPSRVILLWACITQNSSEHLLSTRCGPDKHGQEKVEALVKYYLLPDHVIRY